MRSLLLLVILAQIPGEFRGCSYATGPEEPRQVKVTQLSGTAVLLDWSQVDEATSYKVTW